MSASFKESQRSLIIIQEIEELSALAPDKEIRHL